MDGMMYDGDPQKRKLLARFKTDGYRHDENGVPPEQWMSSAGTRKGRAGRGFPPPYFLQNRDARAVQRQRVARIIFPAAMPITTMC